MNLQPLLVNLWGGQAPPLIPGASESCGYCQSCDCLTQKTSCLLSERHYGQEVFSQFLFFVYVYVSVYLCVARCTSLQCPEVKHLLELELQVVVSSPLWVLGTELRSEAELIHAVNLRAVYPPPS